MIRSGLVVALAVSMGCTAVNAGSRRVQTTAASVGHRIEERADDLAHKGRGFWSWLTGSEEKPRRKKTAATRSAPAPRAVPAAPTLDSRPAQYVGTER